MSKELWVKARERVFERKCEKSLGFLSDEEIEATISQREIESEMVDIMADEHDRGKDLRKYGP